jgi:flagellar biogenesis protein FliO
VAKPNPLDQLKDIHLPEAVSWWPPTLATVLCSLLALIAVVAFITWQYKRFQLAASKRSALKTLSELEQKNLTDKQYLEQIAVLIRKFCIQQKPSSAQLQGEAYLQFLQQYMAEAEARTIAIHRYQSDTNIDKNALSAASRALFKGLKKEAKI